MVKTRKLNKGGMITDYYSPKTPISQITANKKLLQSASIGDWEGIEYVLIRKADINYQDSIKANINYQDEELLDSEN